MNPNKAVCVISKEYDKDWIEFLNTFEEYDVYFIIDNNEVHYNDNKDFSKTNLIQIQNLQCKSNGFMGLVSLFRDRFKEVSGWDKALYYFTTINTKYDYVWFLETDVYFYSEYTLIQIDNECQTEDLLAHGISEHKITTAETSFPSVWHWPSIFRNHSNVLGTPYYHCLPCHTRMSKSLLLKIKEYASKYKSLYFLEAFFPSLCVHNNMTYNNLLSFNPLSRPCEELQYDIKQRMFTTHKNSFFHPIKNTKEHTERRKLLALNASI